jgi:hypothetical protein
MKKLTLAFLLTLVAGVGPLAAQTPTPATTPATTPAERASFTLPHVLDTVGKLIDQPMPKGLSPADQKAYAAQTAWLKTVRSRLQALNTKSAVADAQVTAPRDAASGQATGKRQHKPMVLHTEITTLQQSVEGESKQFTATSQVLKARHDIAMNAIRNLKA